MKQAVSRVAVQQINGLLSQASAFAVPGATSTVNVTGDAGNAVIDGACGSNPTGNGQQCTLRATVEEANASTAMAHDRPSHRGRLWLRRYNFRHRQPFACAQLLRKSNNSRICCVN